MLNQYNQVDPDVRRSFLTALSATLDSLTIGASIVISGTSITLLNVERIYSGKVVSLIHD